MSMPATARAQSPTEAHPQEPLTPTAWRDAPPVERRANAMTAAGFASAENRRRKADNAIMTTTARWSRRGEIEPYQAVYIFDTLIAGASGRSTIGAPRLGKLLGIHADTVTRARKALAEGGLILREVRANSGSVVPVVPGYKALADADFHDLFNDWAPPAKMGRPLTDNHCESESTLAVNGAGVPKSTPAEEGKYPRSSSSMLGLNPGFAPAKSIEEQKDSSGGESTALVVSSTSDREATPGELVPVVTEQGSPMVALLEEAGASLASSVRAALETEEVRAEFRRHLVGGVLPLELAGVANRVWAAGKPLRWCLMVLNTDVGRLRAKATHKSVAQSSGVERPNRGNGRELPALTIENYGGTSRVYIEEADVRRVMAEASVDRDRAYCELQATTEPLAKRGKLPTAKKITDETIARLRGEPYESKPELTPQEQLLEELRQIEAEQEAEQHERDIKMGER